MTIIKDPKFWLAAIGGYFLYMKFVKKSSSPTLYVEAFDQAVVPEVTAVRNYQVMAGR